MCCCHGKLPSNEKDKGINVVRGYYVNGGRKQILHEITRGNMPYVKTSCCLVNDITVVEEERIGKTRHKFRQLSREVCGDVYDIPDENRVLFAYKTLPSKPLLIGGISFQLADEKISNAGTNFDSEFYHMINFLFVKSDYQGLGVGMSLVNKALDIMTSVVRRPVRVQSAEKAVGFFQKVGFETQGEPFESMCSIKLFKVMVNMEFDKT